MAEGLSLTLLLVDSVCTEYLPRSMIPGHSLQIQSKTSTPNSCSFEEVDALIYDNSGSQKRSYIKALGHHRVKSDEPGMKLLILSSPKISKTMIRKWDSRLLCILIFVNVSNGTKNLLHRNCRRVSLSVSSEASRPTKTDEFPLQPQVYLMLDGIYDEPWPFLIWP